MAEKKEEKKEKKFGPFKNADEINAKAAELLAAGDVDGIKELAKETGIDEEDAQDYADGIVSTLCNDLMAALGRIKVESEELDIFGPFEMWRDFIVEGINTDVFFGRNVMDPGKTLVGAFAAVIKEEGAKRKAIDKKICKAAGIPENVQASTLTKKQQIAVIRKYYTGYEES